MEARADQFRADLDVGAKSVADWAEKNGAATSKLVEMRKRNEVLARVRARLHAGAEKDFKAWVAQLKAGTAPPADNNNPGFFAMHYANLPDGHDHPGQPPNLAWGQRGPGTPGGWPNADPKIVHRLTREAVGRANRAAGALTAVAGGLVIGEGVATGLDLPIAANMDASKFSGTTLDALAFGTRGE